MLLEKRPLIDDLYAAILDILPNPVLIKDENLRYVLVNSAFEKLFDVRRQDLVGDLDKNVFKHRQAAQCNGGDLRVLESGCIDEATETVYSAELGPRETITRKSRLSLDDGRVFLVGIMHDITEVSLTNQQLKESQILLEKQAAALQQMANTDPLTKCGNRRRFSSHVPKTFATNRNQGSLLVFDIDHFKKINDRYGHDVGDAVLIHFVDTVTRNLREGTELVRLGGEEFAIALPGVPAEAAFKLAERIRKTIESTPMMHEDEPISITVSVGLCHSDGRDAMNLDKLLSKGDQCLYEAKKRGRNQVVCDSSLGKLI